MATQSRNLNNLRIDNPCPMVLSRMDKKEKGIFCNSCNKQVIDFRNMSPEEVKSRLSRNTCGIFRLEQLPGQRRMRFMTRCLFYVLVFFSFFGVSVKPLRSQPPQGELKKDTTGVEGKHTKKTDKKKSPKKEAKKSRKRKAYFRRRKFQPMGCPNF